MPISDNDDLLPGWLKWWVFKLAALIVTSIAVSIIAFLCILLLAAYNAARSLGQA